jgi:hypothetical protein
METSFIGMPTRQNGCDALLELRLAAALERHVVVGRRFVQAEIH